MKSFYEKHIFFCTNFREGSNKMSCGKSGSKELRNYMKQKVKDLGIKRVRINSAGCLNRCKLGPLIVSYPEGNWYKVSEKVDVDLLIEELLVKKNVVKKLLLDK
jgi:(2Fe-2S) ferredoxin